MQTIELISGISPSVLGFGCAPILGSVEAERSLNALNIAWDNGVNYFDVAPSYGFGQAEQLLGKFLSGKRDKAVIATKFGIEAHPAAGLLAPLKPIIRALKGSKPSTGGSQPQSNSGGGLAGRLLQRKPINTELLKSSVERSLKRLQTDRIDLLFIHEPLESVANVEDLLLAVNRLKQDGKLQAFGVAAMFEDMEKLHRQILPSLDLVQCGIPDQLAAFTQLETERNQRPNILFGAMRARKVIGGASDSVPDALVSLSRRFPKSVLLCSMFNPDHIAANCRPFQS